MIRIAVLFVLTLVLELGLLPGLIPNIQTPELFLPAIITLSVVSERPSVPVFAFIAGLVLDFYFVKAFGVRTALFFTISYLISRNRENFSSASIFTVLTLTLLIGLGYLVLYFLIANVRGSVSLRTLIDSIFSLEIPLQMLYAIISFAILNHEKRRR